MAVARQRVLVVDDDRSSRHLMERFVASEGRTVESADDGLTAIAMLTAKRYDLVICDLAMPGMDGLEVLSEARKRDPDLQFIVVTGAPSVGTAALAMEYGACLYVSKPIERVSFLRAVNLATERRRDAVAKRGALALLEDKVALQRTEVAQDAALTRALDQLWMAYQPIVRAADGTIFGHEALLRSTEPALPNPGVILDVAEQRGRLHELGRRVRGAAAAPMQAAPHAGALFVNLHGEDLLDPELLSPRAPLSAIADRVILEVTERVSLDAIGDVRAKVAQLRSMGFRIAVDDLGAGYAGLASVAALEPEVMKLDMSLVRGIDENAKKQALVRALTTLGKDLGSLIVAEGVETEAEKSALIALGCDLLQGYLIARPARPFPEVRW